MAGSTGASSIQVKSFIRSLISTWKDSQAHRSKWPGAGIAVSGGVDSMALALLCAKARIRHPNFRIVALIVDHKARKGSTSEAFRTRQRLRHLGLRTAILPLQWPADIQPLDIPAFETKARILRYQALGKACRALELSFLITAHHEDDQAETILMRLANGHRGNGLQGIPRMGDVPECRGLHGVHQSGGLNVLADQNCPPSVESGGVQILRPLLDYSKQQLTSTCREHGIIWEEDHTNAEYWRSPRHTIRQLLRSEKLPQALRKPMLLELSRRCRLEQRKLEREVDNAVRQCELALNTRSGVLRVSIPSTFYLSTDDNTSLDIQQIKTKLLEKLLRHVTPLAHLRHASLANAANILFLTPPSTLFPPQSSHNQTKSFTVSGVLYEHLPSPDLPDHDGGKTWQLSREPFSRTFPPRNVLIPIQSSKVIRVHAIWTSWSLWDGRFWTRLRLPYPPSQGQRGYTIRALRKEDMQLLRSTMSKDSFSRLRAVMREVCPGKIRFTLPVIVRVDAQGEERLMGLPTLGSAGVVDTERDVRWEVRYRKI